MPVSPKIGDRVKIVDNVGITIHEDALKYLGTTVTIAEVMKGGCYKVEEDGGNLIWDDYLFEKVL